MMKSRKGPESAQASEGARTHTLSHSADESKTREKQTKATEHFVVAPNENEAKIFYNEISERKYTKKKEKQQNTAQQQTLKNTETMRTEKNARNDGTEKEARRKKQYEERTGKVEETRGHSDDGGGNANVDHDEPRDRTMILK